MYVTRPQLFIRPSMNALKIDLADTQPPSPYSLQLQSKKAVDGVTWNVQKRGCVRR